MAAARAQLNCHEHSNKFKEDETNSQALAGHSCHFCSERHASSCLDDFQQYSGVAL